MSLIALAQAQGQQANPMMNMVTLFLILAAIWWFLVIKPQRTQEKQHQSFLDSLKPGTKVITTGGFYGTVSQVSDKTIKLKLTDNVKVEVTRAAIAGPQPSTDSSAKSS